MEMLGLESLEELEIALDSLEGIASDGGELDTENIAREARVRDAYLKWCRQYNKEPDESRFPTFSNNFLMLEQYAKESAKEMTLNQYADFTKEEYEAMQSGGATPSTVSSTGTNGAVETNVKPKPFSGFDKLFATAAKAAQSAMGTFESSMKSATDAAKSVEISVDRDELVETATNSLEKVMEIAAKGIDAGLQAMDEQAEKTPETEEERAEREARMKALEQERIEAEKREAEARAKRAAELAEKAQQEAARRKEIEEERAAREKALIAEAAKAKEQAEKATIAAAQAAAASEAARAAQRAAIEAQAAQKARQQARAWEEQQQKLNAKRNKVVAPKKKGWTFAIPTASTPKPSPVVAKPPVKKASAPAAPAFSFFSPAPAPVKKVVVAPKKVAPAPSTPFSFFPSPSVAKSTPAPPKKAVTVSPSFSVFSRKTAAVPAPAPAPAPPKSQPFSFFGSSPSAPITKPKVAAKASSSSGSIGLFAPKPAQKKDVKVPTRAGTISINGATKESTKPAQKTFTIFNTPKVETVPVKKAEPAQKAPAFSFFGSSPVTKSAPAAKKPDVVVPNRAGTLSIFGTKAPPPKNVPILSQWRQNADGSIVGKVSNSQGFRAGTEITTSPVKKGAKAGTVVTTGSGSKYYLN